MQLQADLHTHTVASTHGYSTLSEMMHAAAGRQLRLLATTDHGPAMPDAPHLWHFHNYKVLPRQIEGVWLLKGVEANVIDENGTLDMGPEELSFCEWVIASYHACCVQFERTPERVTQGYRKLCDNPLVDVIGHCTTEAFPFDYAPILKLFREAGKLVELNEGSIRWKTGALENAKTVFSLCKRYEVPIVVNTDAHYAGLVGRTPLALQLLADLDFPSRLIVNLDAACVMQMASEKRGLRFAVDASIGGDE